uniref:Uncharacterized protein n=1 Tax=Glossina palpalis gambiensis TaxID=67801 RepID=A0A1B0B7M7_9MUSC
MPESSLVINYFILTIYSMILFIFFQHNRVHDEDEKREYHYHHHYHQIQIKLLKKKRKKLQTIAYCNK